jgi:hypothetical protein
MRLPRSAATARCLAAALLLAGCATLVERRVADELADAGVPAAAASCMAEIWANDLSVEQIRGISRFARTVREDRETLTLGRLVDHVREWGDTQALRVVTTSAARCAFR